MCTVQCGSFQQSEEETTEEYNAKKCVNIQHISSTKLPYLPSTPQSCSYLIISPIPRDIKVIIIAMLKRNHLPRIPPASKTEEMKSDF